MRMSAANWSWSSCCKARLRNLNSQFGRPATYRIRYGPPPRSMARTRALLANVASAVFVALALRRTSSSGATRSWTNERPGASGFHCSRAEGGASVRAGGRFVSARMRPARSSTWARSVALPKPVDDASSVADTGASSKADNATALRRTATSRRLASDPTTTGYTGGSPSSGGKRPGMSVALPSVNTSTAANGRPLKRSRNPTSDDPRADALPEKSSSPKSRATRRRESKSSRRTWKCSSRDRSHGDRAGSKDSRRTSPRERGFPGSWMDKPALLSATIASRFDPGLDCSLERSGSSRHNASATMAVALSEARSKRRGNAPEAR